MTTGSWLASGSRVGDDLAVVAAGQQGQRAARVEVLIDRTLPSPNASGTTPGSQLPNWPRNGVAGPCASGKAVPAFRPVTYAHLLGWDE